MLNENTISIDNQIQSNFNIICFLLNNSKLSIQHSKFLATFATL